MKSLDFDIYNLIKNNRNAVLTVNYPEEYILWPADVDESCLECTDGRWRFFNKSSFRYEDNKVRGIVIDAISWRLFGFKPLQSSSGPYLVKLDINLKTCKKDIDVSFVDNSVHIPSIEVFNEV
jgi:hypothetical protein